MNENINLVEILKDAPKGTKLWSPICGECELIKVYTEYPFTIICTERHDRQISFTAKGKYTYLDGECILFPSKDNRDWSTFEAPRMHKYFNPFQKVLVAYLCPDLKWKADLYSHYSKEEDHPHICLSGFTFDDDKIIPYEGNEDELGRPVK